MAATDGRDGTAGRRVGLAAVVLLLFGTLGISTAFGMLLLLPLYVQELGGNEANFGVILSSAMLTAVLCIGLLIRYPEALRPHAVVALAIVVYAAGAAGAALVTETWTPLVGIGVLLGTAWAVVYTATPMVMSQMVTDEGRATYFGYLTGTQQIGIGVGPVIARVLVETDLGFRGTFLVASMICLAAAGLTVAVGFLTSDPRTEDAEARGGVSADKMAVPFGDAIRRILRSEAVFSLVMILLFACLFTSMTQFQTTFARSQGIDYSVFYVTYTAAVIFSRFVLARMASRFDTRLVIASAVSVMALGMAAFLLVESSVLIYGLASGLLGLGYGLALPSAQAQAVNVSEESVRPRVLPVAGLLFQAAILGFPLVAGWIIVGPGYLVLFAVLVFFALVQASIGWWRYWVARRASGLVSAPPS
ncbi:MAG: MFS transporter [Actinomycetota bacterium]|nr:MFS transporter [Actinomycetota bacterium]